MSAKLAIGFLGAGKMATALARGFIQAKLAGADQIIAGDPVDAARSAFAGESGSKTTTSNLEVLKFAGVVLLSMNLRAARRNRINLTPEKPGEQTKPDQFQN